MIVTAIAIGIACCAGVGIVAWRVGRAKTRPPRLHAGMEEERAAGPAAQDRKSEQEEPHMTHTPPARRLSPPITTRRDPLHVPQYVCPVRLAGPRSKIPGCGYLAYVRGAPITREEWLRFAAFDCNARVLAAAGIDDPASFKLTPVPNSTAFTVDPRAYCPPPGAHGQRHEQGQSKAQTKRSRVPQAVDVLRGSVDVIRGDR